MSMSDNFINPMDLTTALLHLARLQLCIRQEEAMAKSHSADKQQELNDEQSTAKLECNRQQEEKMKNVAHAEAWVNDRAEVKYANTCYGTAKAYYERIHAIMESTDMAIGIFKSIQQAMGSLQLNSVQNAEISSFVADLEADYHNTREDQRPF